MFFSQNHPTGGLPLSKQLGFTLIELMVTVSILAILLGIGVPSFRATIQGNRVASVSSDLVAALHFARSEAVRRGENVTLCSSNDQATCSGDWVDGWVVRSAAATIRVWPTAREGVVIAVPGEVVFNPLGGVTAARCFQVSLDAILRSVSVGAMGRVTTAVAACP